MAKTKSGEWLLWSLPEEELTELLLRAEEAEITDMHPGPVFLLGALTALVLALGLLVASL